MNQDLLFDTPPTPPKHSITAADLIKVAHMTNEEWDASKLNDEPKKKPTPVAPAPELPFFVQEAEAQVARARRDRVAAQLRHWHWMWPEWDGVFRIGMRVCCGCWGTLVEDGKTVGGFDAKAGQCFYSQMAPAYILEVLDPETFIVVIDYPKGTDCPEHRVTVEHHNGIKLKFDICDLDPAYEYWINNSQRVVWTQEGEPEQPELLDMTGCPKCSMQKGFCQCP